MPTARERWFAEILHAGLETKLATEQDVVAHATPAVLIACLPRDVLARVLGGALAANAMSPRSIIDTVSLELLAEKAPPNVTWACIAQIADRAGITGGAPTDNTASREFLRRTLASALSTGVLVAKDVVAHIDAEVLATCFPDDLTTKLLEVSLAANKFNPELILDTLGVPAIAKHAPVEVVWACFVKPGEGAVKAPPIQAPKPALEVIDHDDDMPAVLVEMDDVKDHVVSAKPG